MSPVQFHGSFDYAESAPSFDQLDGAVVTTVNRVFDFARQEWVDVLWTTRGNPDLRRGSRRSFSLTALVRPFDDQRRSLNIGYRRQSAKSSIAAFPELTPAIEAAFPDRVVRDAGGRLIAINARAIDIVGDTDG